MKKIILSCIVIAALASCNSTRLRPSGNVISENREVGVFSSVSVESGLRLHIKASQEPTLTVTADDNLISYIETYVSGDRLFVRVKGNVWFSGHATLDIYAGTPSVNSASASGGAQVIVDGTLEADDFSVTLEGGSRMKGSLTVADRLTANLAGGSNMEVTGSCSVMQLNLAGGSRFTGQDFRSVNASVNAAGGSNATIYSSGSLSVNAGGGSHIVYYGNPTNTNLVSEGGSKIESRGN